VNTQRIVVLGGTGFIGGHLLPRLAEDGHELWVLTRNREKHRELTVTPHTRLISVDVYDRKALTRHMRGANAVINLVGILNESHPQTFQRVHVELTRTVIAAAADAGIVRLHQMSSLKAGQGRSGYLRSRGKAEALVEQSGMAWTIYQPSTVFGPGDGLVSRFAGLLRLTPVLPLPRPQAKMAPVYVGDVVEAFARSIANPQLSLGRRFQLFGPDTLTLIDIVRMIRDAAGLHRGVIGMSDALGVIQAMLAGLLPGKPFTLDNFRSLLTDSIGSDSGLAALGIHPHALTPMLPHLLQRPEHQRRLDHARAEHSH
jgi:uncharacterized protein YbjT (DUF2867 family)